MRNLFWAVIAVFLLFFCLFLSVKQIEDNPRGRVLTPQERDARFEKIKHLVFVGKEGKRPFIITCNGYVWNRDKRTWIKYQ